MNSSIEQPIVHSIKELQHLTGVQHCTISFSLILYTMAVCYILFCSMSVLQVDLTELSRILLFWFLFRWVWFFFAGFLLFFLNQWSSPYSFILHIYCCETHRSRSLFNHAFIFNAPSDDKGKLVIKADIAVERNGKL